MKLAIELAEPVETEVRRIAGHRLKTAADLLRAPPQGLDEAIHDARRHIKQCRALYRLIASEAKDFQKSENVRLRDIGRQLSGMRDATALIEVTHYLKHEIASRSNAMLMDRLAKRLEQRRRALAHEAPETTEALASAVRALSDAAAALDHFALPHGRRKNATCLARGWEMTGRRARRAITASADDEKAFHELRKRTQDHWMQAVLMRNLWPTAMVSIHGQAKALSDMLGHAHDLTLLLYTVSNSRELANDHVESEALRAAILSQRQKLHGECRNLAVDLFGKSKPRDDVMIRRLLLDL